MDMENLLEAKFEKIRFFSAYDAMEDFQDK